MKKGTAAEVKKIIENGEKQAEILKKQIIGNTEVSARNKSLELVEINASKTFEATMKKLVESPPPNAIYEKILTNFLDESIELMGVKEFVVQGNTRDQPLLRKVASKISQKGFKISVRKEPIMCIGGLKAVTPDGFIMYDNTFEGRLERFKPLLRRDLSRLFLEM